MSRKPKTIYVITMCEKLEKDEETGFPSFGSRFVPGWFANKDTAFDAVKQNASDINETCYDYAVIERIKEGLYSPAFKGERWIFKYNRETDTYEEIQEPDFLSHFCGFAMN